MLRVLRNVVLLLAAVLPTTVLADATQLAEPAAGGLAAVLLGVSINGADQGATTFLREGDELYVSLEDLAAWRVKPPEVLPVMRKDKAFVPISALPGVAATIDEERQIARLEIPPELFEASAIEANQAAAASPTEGAFAAFANYELLGEQSGSDTSFGAFFETGISDDWGLLSNTLSIQESTAEGNLNGETARLDTFFLRDDPENLTRLQVGDAITRGSDWARPVRFGGVKFGTDFGLQPNFISFPTPSFDGRATLPSTVEAYVNDALRFSSDVPEGPFTIRQVPVVTGAGEVRFVIKDTLGVERTVTVPYYVSSRILREGLSDYSLEIGLEREDYGIDSFDYGQPFGAATYRYGLTSTLTAEGHVELARREQLAGASLGWVWPEVGEFGFSGAGSTGERGQGALGMVSFSRVDRWWSISLSYQRTTEDFVQLGGDEPAEQIRTQAQAFAGLSLGGYGSVSLGYAALELGDGTNTDVASISYDVPLSDFAYLNAFGLVSDASDEDDRSTTVGLSLTFPLGERRSATTQVSRVDGRMEGMAEYRRDPPFGTGFGYRLTVNRNDFNRGSGALTWRTDVGTLTGEIAATDEEVAGRVIASGGLAYVGGAAFASRRIEDGFGIVSIPGYPHVRVYQENQLLAETDSDGNAIIPSMRAYEENRIRIETNDLPLDAAVDADTLSLVPRYRGAVVASFPVTDTRGIVARLLLPDGSPLPPGIPINVDDQESAAFSGHDGEVFITGAKSGTVLEALWDAGHCRATVGAIPADEKLPRLGSLVCQPVGTL